MPPSSRARPGKGRRPAKEDAGDPPLLEKSILHPVLDTAEETPSATDPPFPAETPLPDTGEVAGVAGDTAKFDGGDVDAWLADVFQTPNDDSLLVEFGLKNPEADDRALRKRPQKRRATAGGKGVAATVSPQSESTPNESETSSTESSSDQDSDWIPSEFEDEKEPANESQKEKSSRDQERPTPKSSRDFVDEQMQRLLTLLGSPADQDESSSSEALDDLSSLSSGDLPAECTGTMDELIMDALEGSSHRQPKKKRRKKRAKKKSRPRAASASQLTPQLKAMLEDANDAYLNKEFDRAIRAYEEIVQQASGLHDPFQMLGLIYEELGQKKKSLEFNLLAAHLLQTDYDSWHRCAMLSEEAGNLDQTIYCYSRALRSRGVPVYRPGPREMLAERMTVDDQLLAHRLSLALLKAGRYQRAAKVLEILLVIHSEDMEIVIRLAKCYYLRREYHRALSLLEGCLAAESAAFISPSPPPKPVLPYSFSLAEALSDRSKVLVGHACSLVDDSPPMAAGDAGTGVKPKMPQEDLSWEIIDLLCDIYIDTENYRKCSSLLEGNLWTTPVTAVPLEMITKMSICAIHLGKANSVLVKWTEQSLLSCNPEDAPMNLLSALGDAFYFTGNHRRALNLYMFVTTNAAFNPSIWVKAARCHLMTQDPEAAVLLLERCAQTSPPQEDEAVQQSALTIAATSRRLLQVLLGRLGRSPAAETVLTSISHRDFVDQEYLPPPLPVERRRLMLRTLLDGCERLNEDYPLPLADALKFTVSGLRVDPDKASPLTTAGTSAWTDWAAEFVSLIVDVELDTRRLVRLGERHRLEERLRRDETLIALKDVEVQSDDDNDKTALVTFKEPKRKRRRVNDEKKIANMQTARLRSDMGLFSLEEELGWPKYEIFIDNGLRVMACLGMFREAYELIETIIASKKMQRSQHFCIERRQLREKLTTMSLNYAVADNLLRVAVSTLRQRYLRRPDASKRILQLFVLLMFTGRMTASALQSLTSCTDRELLLENRSWVVRQLLQRRRNYILTMIVGHFCVLSGRGAFAVAEYTRAWVLKPGDFMALFCLAIAYVNLGTSRAVTERHLVIIRGFALLQEAVRLREADGRQMAEKACNELRQMLKELRSGSHAPNCRCRPLPAVLQGLLARMDAVWTPQGAEEKLIEALRSAVQSHVLMEALYNLGRAFHQLHLLHLAVNIYHRVEAVARTKKPSRMSQKLIDDLLAGETSRRRPPANFPEDVCMLEWLVFRTLETARAVSCSSPDHDLPLPAALDASMRCGLVPSAAACTFLFTVDAEQLRMLAAYNRSIILQSSHCLEAATDVQKKSIVWGD